MPRIKAKKIKAPKIHERPVDATRERLAKGDWSEFVNPAKIDSSEQPIGRTRRFKVSHLDRLHRRGALNEHQYQAGDWYRNTHARGRYGSPVVANYGDSNGGSQLTYGLLRTEAQARARQQLRHARDQLPFSEQRVMDSLLIEDDIRSVVAGHRLATSPEFAMPWTRWRNTYGAVDATGQFVYRKRHLREPRPEMGRGSRAIWRTHLPAHRQFPPRQHPTRLL